MTEIRFEDVRVGDRVRVRPVIDRVLAKVVEDANGCWIFTGSLDPNGYGRIKRGGRGAGITPTHRATYTYFVADIPDGLELDHLCRVRACCNPGHLEPVTHAENNRRRFAAMDCCHHGHQFDEANTAFDANGYRRCRACNRRNAKATYYRGRLVPVKP